MATVAFLKTEDISEPPEDVEIQQNYGGTTVVTENETVRGDHVVVSGPDESIKGWLRPHSPILVSKGPLVMEQFEKLDVRD